MLTHLATRANRRQPAALRSRPTIITHPRRYAASQRRVRTLILTIGTVVSSLACRKNEARGGRHEPGVFSRCRAVRRTEPGPRREGVTVRRRDDPCLLRSEARADHVSVRGADTSRPGREDERVRELQGRRALQNLLVTWAHLRSVRPERVHERYGLPRGRFVRLRAPERVLAEQLPRRERLWWTRLRARNVRQQPRAELLLPYGERHVQRGRPLRPGWRVCVSGEGVGLSKAVADPAGLSGLSK